MKRRYDADPETARKRYRDYYTANADRLGVARRARVNTDEGRERNRVAVKKYRSTPSGRINHRTSARMFAGLSGVRRGSNWRARLGYTVADLRAHLECGFLPGMSWDNIGDWHIDHIVPLASFTFSSADDPEFRAAWALTNLRPLWAADNMRKHARREFLL